MFDAICITAAGLLAAFVIDRYRFIAVAIFVEFSLHQIVYQWGVVDNSHLDPWLIYFAYATIQIFIISYLYFIKSHFIIGLLIMLNMTYNLIATYFGYMYWENDQHLQIFRLIYANYSGFVGTIMIFELLYMAFLCKLTYGITEENGKYNLDNIDRLFRVRGWNGHGDMV